MTIGGERARSGSGCGLWGLFVFPRPDAPRPSHPPQSRPDDHHRRHESRDDDYEREGPRRRAQTSTEPTSTLRLGLPLALSEAELLVALQPACAEVPPLEYARSFRERLEPFEVRGGRVQVDFALPLPQANKDWPCARCGYVNFGRRNRCHGCDSERGAEVTPSPLVMLQKLPQLANPDRLRKLVLPWGSPIDVRVPLDAAGFARGFGFVEFSTLAEAALLVQSAQQQPLILDGSPLVVLFADPNRGPPRRNAEPATSQPSAQNPPAWTSPDGRNWQHDPASGCYYEPATGYFWDAQKQLAFDGVNQRHLLYDPATRQYSPFPSPNPSSSAASSAPAASLPTPQPNSSSSPTPSSTAPSSTPSAQPKKRIVSVVAAAAPAKPLSEPPPPPPPEPTLPPLPLDLITNDNYQCLLCQRQFPDEEKLERHCLQSELHKTNLEAKVKGASQAERKRFLEFAESELPSAKRARLEPPPPVAPAFAPNPNEHQPMPEGTWDHQVYMSNVKKSFRDLYSRLK